MQPFGHLNLPNCFTGTFWKSLIDCLGCFRAKMICLSHGDFAFLTEFQSPISAQNKPPFQTTPFQHSKVLGARVLMILQCAQFCCVLSVFCCFVSCFVPLVCCSNQI